MAVCVRSHPTAGLTVRAAPVQPHQLDPPAHVLVVEARVVAPVVEPLAPERAHRRPRVVADHRRGREEEPVLAGEPAQAQVDVLPGAQRLVEAAERVKVLRRMARFIPGKYGAIDAGPAFGR